jgi:hypothetical protein
MRTFDDETFLAYIDISGFKKLIKYGNASEALDSFYQHGYDVVHKYHKLNGIFASDSGIIFIDDSPTNSKNNLNSLLIAIKEINKLVLDDGFILTTSVAYGHFKFEKKIEFERFRKNKFFGNAFVQAFLDNDDAKIKIRPGECRILKETIPDSMLDHLRNRNFEENIFKFLEYRNGYYYSYWMVNDISKIKDIKSSYEFAYESRYDLIKKVLNNTPFAFCV